MVGSHVSLLYPCEIAREGPPKIDVAGERVDFFAVDQHLDRSDRRQVRRERVDERVHRQQFAEGPTAVRRGLGDGGNITLKTNLLLMRDSIVSANAFGGNGGNVSIGAVNLFSNPATKVTASSQLGIDGTVVFQSPAIDLSGALLSLPTGFLDVSAIAAGRCGARLASGSSSLVVRRFDASEALRNGFRMSSAGGPSEGALAADLALCEPRDIAPSFVAAR